MTAGPTIVAFDVQLVAAILHKMHVAEEKYGRKNSHHVKERDT